MTTATPSQFLSKEEAIERFSPEYPGIDVPWAIEKMVRDGRQLTASTCRNWLSREFPSKGPQTTVGKKKRERQVGDNTIPPTGFREFWGSHEHGGYCDEQHPQYGNSREVHWGILPSIAWMCLRYREEWREFQAIDL
ncbi:MAG TPA: hypothetical protein VIS96_10940 [Terrimicrobiaceae bacterium]